jgi:lipoate-protein ligase A
MNWRLIDTDIADPYYVTAADEALCLARKENQVWNTLHFYRRNPAAVSVGRSRRISDDVDVDECLKNNVRIVRRASGGGTIFTDKMCLIYSLVFDVRDSRLKSSSGIFKDVCGCLVAALKRLDINAVYKPPNDVLLNGKKISGSAQMKKLNIVEIHGTILIDSDLELMIKVLKQVENTKGVSTISREIGYSPSIGDVKEGLIKEFETYFDTTFEKTMFSPYEKFLTERLLRERYLNDRWNFMR